MTGAVVLSAALLAGAVLAAGGLARPVVRARAPDAAARGPHRAQSWWQLLRRRLLGRRLLGRWPVLGRGRREAAVRVAVVELLETAAAELRAGRTPDDAVRRAVAEVPPGALAAALGPVAECARLGGDLPAGLRAAAALPGAHALGWLAAAWQVAALTGAGLAAALEQLATAGRADDEQRRRVAVQLAGPRATARLLAALPVFGLLLGSALGATPLRVLLGTPVGWALAVLGAGLDGLGLWWTARLARAVERAR